MPIPISVLLPVYNAESTLVECLDSIQSQTYDHFEAVIIDDGSSDHTANILSRFAAKDQRFKIHSLTHNQGIVNALNLGLAQCQGDYIARMDADDRMLPERLAMQLSFARNHPEVDLIGSRFRLFRDDAPLSPAQLRYEQWSNSLLDDQAVKSSIFLEAPLAHPTFFAKRSFFTDMRGYRDCPWAEDYDFLLRACERNAVFAKTSAALIEKRDSPTRLYRTDPRCKRQAMLRAKAHFFARRSNMHAHKRIVLVGSGSTARTAAKALKQEGMAIAGFIDNHQGPPGRTVLGLPTFYNQSSAAGELLRQTQDYFFILCIGDPQGRTEREAQFIQAGLVSGNHYLRFL